MDSSLLAIETSSEACSVAVCIDGEMLERFEHAPMKHAERLLPAVRALLAEAQIGLADIDAIAFGRGPGSFTSLRIGIGVVQGLAWGAGLPVVPVSSLAAVAQEAAGQFARADTGGTGQQMPAADYIRVAVDARMGEVFSGDFSVAGDGLVKATGDERVCAPGDLACGSGPFVAAGNGFERFDELQALGRSALACYPDIWPRAAMIARLAKGWLRDSKPLPASQAQPVYIRNQVAIKSS